MFVAPDTALCFELTECVTEGGGTHTAELAECVHGQGLLGVGEDEEDALLRGRLLLRGRVVGSRCADLQSGGRSVVMKL